MTVLGPLARLRVHLERELAQAGLRLHYLGVVPATEPLGRHHVQLLLTLANESPQPVDDGFEEVLRSARAAEQELRAQETIEDLRRRFGDDTGFL